jgi:hypothetical protein
VSLSSPANSVAALDEVLADEGGMALNRPLALHLFQQLRTLNEWGQSLVMGVLARYRPEDEDEVFSILVRCRGVRGLAVPCADLGPHIEHSGRAPQARQRRRGHGRSPVVSAVH